MIEEKFQMLDGENTDEYTIRICSMREDENLTWQEVADIINEETDRSYSEKKYGGNHFGWGMFIRNY